MGKNKKIFGFVILMLCSTFCFARQISFQIVQHDESSTEVIEQSLQVEDTILNGLFDEGYIVTNSAAAVSDSEEQDETLLKKGIGEAFEGFSDYFVQIKLYFATDNPAAKGKKNLEQVDWILTSAKTGVKVCNDSIKAKVVNEKTEDLYKITSDLLIQIKKAIKA